MYTFLPFEIAFDLAYGYWQAFTGSIIEHDDNLSAIQSSRSEKVRHFLKLPYGVVHIYIDMLSYFFSWTFGSLLVLLPQGLYLDSSCRREGIKFVSLTLR